ncbi:hypothetical protein [Saudi moumouvirus]|nr:hypothetical protein [Saudi moumouvirus]
MNIYNMESIDDMINKLHDINYYLNIIYDHNEFEKDLTYLNYLVSDLEKKVKNISLTNEQEEKLNKALERDKKLYKHMFPYYWNYIEKIE